MDSEYIDRNGASNFDRRTYFTVINGDAVNEKTNVAREYTTLDLFPTTVAALGVQIEGNKLGLGVNLYSSEPTLIERYGDEYMDVLADGNWEKTFTEKPAVFTKEEKRAWLDQMTDVTLGSDAFFPFSDNIERAYKSGVKYIAQPGGSVRDADVIDTCNKYNIAMAFTGIRLFHH